MTFNIPFQLVFIVDIVQNPIYKGPGILSTVLLAKFNRLINRNFGRDIFQK